MTTIKAKRIQEALEKAKNVGQVEESVTIAGCPIVLQSLTPTEYEDILAECENVRDLSYLHAYQAGHVTRSIVEIDGQSLRDVEFIEEEVPTGAWGLAAFCSEAVAKEAAAAITNAGGEVSVLPPDGTETRVIKVERYEWLRKHVVSSWSQQALAVAWRKFAEVVVEADRKAKEGIQFLIPDETDEDKYRRLVNEMKEVEDDLPVEIVSTVLKEAGYMLSDRASEIEAATAKLDKLKEESDATIAAAEAQAAQDVSEGLAEVGQEPPQAAPEPPAAPQPPAPAPQPVAPQAAPQAPPAPVAARPSPEDLMRRRQPLNQQAVNTPTAPQPTDRAVVSASPRTAVPEQLRQAALSNSEGMSRADRIAALEGHVDPSLQEAAAQQQLVRPEPSDVPVLDKQKSSVDSKTLAASVDRPPAAGINPRFKPQY